MRFFREKSFFSIKLLDNYNNIFLRFSFKLCVMPLSIAIQHVSSIIPCHVLTLVAASFPARGGGVTNHQPRFEPPHYPRSPALAICFMFCVVFMF